MFYTPAALNGSAFEVSCTNLMYKLMKKMNNSNLNVQLLAELEALKMKVKGCTKQLLQMHGNQAMGPSCEQRTKALKVSIQMS